jgi:hypothetical protein
MSSRRLVAVQDSALQTLISSLELSQKLMFPRLINQMKEKLNFMLTVLQMLFWILKEEEAKS